jgi:fructose/tagatose bisphosphate aldolase
MVGRFSQEKNVRTRRYTKFVHEGDFVAEIEVELIESEDGWSPYLSPSDASKLDDAREALRRGDIQAAAHFGRVYELKLLAG